MMQRRLSLFFLLFAIPSLALSNLACTQKATCSGFLDKLVSCTKDEKAKEIFGKRRKSLTAACEEDLANPEKAEWTKKELACVTQKTCEDFDKCAKDVSKQRREARLPQTIEESRKNLEKNAGENKFAAAVDGCYYNFSLRDAAKSTNPAVKSAVQAFYKYCLDNIPAWLVKVRDEDKHGYVSLCSFFRRKPDASKKEKPGFFELSGISEEQKKQMANTCEEIAYAPTLKAVKKAAEKPSTSLPYQCTLSVLKKDAQTQNAGKLKMIEEVKNICFTKIGFKILEANKAKLLKQKKNYRFCGYNDKIVASAIKEFKLEKPEQQETLDFFYKLCKLN